MNARTLSLPTSLNAPATESSGLAGVVSAFVAFVRGALAQPAPQASVAEADWFRPQVDTGWRDLSAELVNAQYGYVGDLHGAVRRYVEASSR